MGRLHPKGNGDQEAKKYCREERILIFVPSFARVFLAGVSGQLLTFQYAYVELRLCSVRKSLRKGVSHAKRIWCRWYPKEELRVANVVQQNLCRGTLGVIRTKRINPNFFLTLLYVKRRITMYIRTPRREAKEEIFLILSHAHLEGHFTERKRAGRRISNRANKPTRFIPKKEISPAASCVILWLYAPTRARVRFALTHVPLTCSYVPRVRGFVGVKPEEGEEAQCGELNSFSSSSIHQASIRNGPNDLYLVVGTTSLLQKPL